MKIYFGSPKSIRTIADAVSMYGGKEFESVTRSTIPMLSLLNHAPDVFNDIVRQLGFPGGFDLFLEYTVRPPKGRGKASHTDVMLMAGTTSLAIEGKWTEPMYETVGKWLKGGKEQSNRNAVLEGWLSLLQQRVATPLHAGDFDDVVYQMVHRAASAATAEKPSLAYFLFKPSTDQRAATVDQIFEKLGDLWDRLGKPGSFSFYVVEIEATPLEPYESLRSLPKDEESTSEIVCTALQDASPLFSFRHTGCRRVGATP